MNLLFISPRFPFPALKGDQLIVHERIKGLSRDFKLTFYESESELKSLSEVEKYCYKVIPIKLSKAQSIKNVISGYFRNNLPLQVSYYESEELRTSVQKVIQQEKIDLIHVFTLRLAEYVRQLSSIPVVYELIDSMQLNIENMIREESMPKKWVYQVEQKRICEYEKQLCETNNFLTVVSQKDKERIGCQHIEVVPNGVDINKFEFSDSFNQGEIIFSGNMGYLPNVHAVKWFVKHSFPIIKHAIPYAKLRIVGANPTSYIKSLDNGTSIEVTGYVESISEELKRAQIAIAPMRSGSGMQNKILEAMACGVPVVTTHNGLEGIFAKKGEEISVADTPEFFAQTIISLLSNEEEYKEMVVRSRNYVEREHSWKASNRKVIDLYLDAYSEIKEYE